MNWDGGLFAQYGSPATCLSTTKVLVETFTAGYFSQELEQLLHVIVKDALRTLVKRKKLYRQQAGGRWLYCSLDRHNPLCQPGEVLEEGGMVKLTTYKETQTDELKAAIVIFFSLLCCLYAGLESIK